MAVVVADGATPRSFTSGNFTLTTLQSGPAFRLTVTPTNASTTNGTNGYDGYRALLATNDDGGLYMVNRRVELYNGAGGGTLTGNSSTLTWLANAPITITVNLAVGTNASSIVVSGALTGNGTSTFTASGTYFTASTLGVGQFTNSNTFLWPGTIGAVDDTAGLTRTAALTVAVDAATAATRTLVRAATFAAAAGIATSAIGAYQRTANMDVAVGASTAATVSSGGGINRAAAMTVAVDAAMSATRVLDRSASATVATDANSAATRTLVRTAAATVAVGASTVATVAGAATFGPGAQTSGLWPFGRSDAVCTIPGGYLPPGGGGADADGRVPPATIDTEATGSTFYLAVARPVATADKTFTDSKGNTWTSLHVGDYGTVSPWESEVAVVVNGAGGTAHTFTANSILFDETTLAVDEIKKCAYLADHATSFTANGSTQISPIGVDLKGPGWVYVDWFGDGAVSGDEGVPWTVTAIDEGSAVGVHWQVVDSRIVNHNGGWIQWKRWRRYYATATVGIRLQLASLAPAQGARWYAAAFMEVNVTTATAAMTVAVDAATSAARRLERTAAATVVVGAASSALASLVRSAAATVAVDASLSAVPARARSAAAEIAVGASTAATVSAQRTASISVSVDAATSAIPVRVRTAALSVAADSATAATRAFERTAAIGVDVGASTSATVVPAGVITRTADLAVAVGAETLATRTLVRSAAMTVVVDAVTSAALFDADAATTPRLPASLSISVVGVEPFRMTIE